MHGQTHELGKLRRSTMDSTDLQFDDQRLVMLRSPARWAYFAPIR